MFKKVAIALIVALAAAAAYYHCPCHKKATSAAPLGKTVYAVSWKACDNPAYPYFSIENLQILGNFMAGTTVTFVTTGTVKKQYTHAYTDTTVKFGIFNVYSGVTEEQPHKTYNPGPLNTRSDNLLKDTAKNGGYTMTLKFQDANKRQFECVEIKYSIKD